LVGGLLLTVGSSFGQTFFIALFSSDIRETFGLSDGELGGVYMLATLASAATLIVVGKIVDYVSVAMMATIVCSSLAAVCFSMSLVNSVLGLGVVLYGLRLLGQGLMTHTAMTAMGRWYERERGRAVALTAVGHQVGEGLFPLLVVSLLSMFAWTQVWQGAAAILLFAALPLIVSLMRVGRLPRNAQLQTQTSNVRQHTRSEVLRDPVFWVLCCTTLMPAFISTSFFFHQQHIGDEKNWSYTLIATNFSVMALSNVVFALIAGVMIDRFSAVRLLPLYLMPLGCACVVLNQFSSVTALWAYMVLIGISGGTANTLLSSIWPEIYGTKHLGSIRSLVMAGMVFSTALGPGVTGWFIDQGVSYPDQTLTMAAFCMLGTVTLIMTSRHLTLRIS